MAFKEATDMCAGDATKYGAPDLRKVMEFLNGKAIACCEPVLVRDTIFTIADGLDTTAKIRFDATLITTCTTRVITAPDANITLGGTVIGTHTQWIPSGSWTSRTTNGPNFAELELACNTIMKPTFNFDQTTSEAIQFWWEPPAEWNAGTITFNAKWTASTGSGNVVWTLSGHSYSNSDALDVAIGGTPGATAADTLSATNQNQITAESAAVTISGATKGESILLQLERTISDSLTADAELFGINITYTIDEATKD